MKTLKSKVVCEDIHIEDYDKRRHRVKTMEREDLAVSSFFYSLLSHRNHRTVKWGPREPVRMTEVMLNQNLCLREKTMRANLVQSWTSQLCL